MAKPWAKAFYNGGAWKTARGEALRRDGFTCQMCGGRAEEVHHIKELSPKRMGQYDITLGQDNLISLCRDCHFLVHEQERALHAAKSNKDRAKPHTRDGFMFDENGQVIRKKIDVTIVWGCPGSGKTTYVRQHMKRGDLVIDLDMIGQALSMDSKTCTPSSIVGTAIKIRDFAYGLIRSRDIDAERVWVVAGLPSRKERDDLARTLNAKLVHIDASLQDCMQRVMRDDERLDKAKQRMIVEMWFAKYEQ